MRCPALVSQFCSLGQVSYSVHSGSDAGKFIVNVSTGVVTLATPLDYEDVSTYALTIRAADSDRSGHVRHVDFTLHVDVIDVNDNSPNFTQKLFTLNLLETLAVGKHKFIQNLREECSKGSVIDLSMITHLLKIIK